jgi:hypothetical protein
MGDRSFCYWCLEVGEAAAFVAAILPMVNECNRASANFIKEHMWIDSETPLASGFAQIKEALENVYACIGIRCDDVGGFLDDNGNYSDGAAPCTDAAEEEEKEEYDDSSDDETIKSSCAMTLDIFVVTIACIMLQMHLALRYL